VFVPGNCSPSCWGASAAMHTCHSLPCPAAYSVPVKPEGFQQRVFGRMRTAALGIHTFSTNHPLLPGWDFAVHI